MRSEEKNAIKYELVDKYRRDDGVIKNQSESRCALLLNEEFIFSFAFAFIYPLRVDDNTNCHQATFEKYH